MKAKKQFNGLTPAGAERLFLLLEELGEAQQAIGKILRHGYESYHPDDIDGDRSNRDSLCIVRHGSGRGRRSRGEPAAPFSGSGD